MDNEGATLMGHPDAHIATGRLHAWSSALCASSTDRAHVAHAKSAAVVRAALSPAEFGAVPGDDGSARGMGPADGAVAAIIRTLAG